MRPQKELLKLNDKRTLLDARIFELECMRDKGLTATEAAGIVASTKVPPSQAPQEPSAAVE